jgi:ribosomal-protein-alanine N-acetyltransferase
MKLLKNTNTIVNFYSQMRFNKMISRFTLNDDAFKITLAYPDDSIDIVKYYQNNMTHLARWEPKKKDGFYSELNWNNFLNKNSKNYHANGDLFFLIKKDSDLLGRINISDIKEYPLHNCTLSYSIDQSYEGTGLMTSSLNRVIKWLSANKNINSINAFAMKKNKNSVNLLERNGFFRICTVPKYAMIAGKWMDHEFYRKEI